jgi:hypothetical protein
MAVLRTVEREFGIRLSFGAEFCRAACPLFIHASNPFAQDSDLGWCFNERESE